MCLRVHQPYSTYEILKTLCENYDFYFLQKRKKKEKENDKFDRNACEIVNSCLDFNSDLSSYVQYLNYLIMLTINRQNVFRVFFHFISLTFPIFTPINSEYLFDK